MLLFDPQVKLLPFSMVAISLQKSALGTDKIKQETK